MMNESQTTTSSFNRAVSMENQEIFMMPRQKSRSRERRESRMFLVDGQLCWSSDQPMGMRGKRNSSVGLFGSSMDLSGIGQSIDSSGGAGSGTEEAISYRIKWCRDSIMQLKRQTWPMEKKLQVLKASKQFIKQHQGELKQSKQAKDVIAGTTAIFERYWRHFKREFANFLVIITPWEMRIKKIESHFGSVVASYFTFLRWIFWLNLANSLVMVSFVMVPELIENVPDLTAMRKGELGAIQQIGSDGKPIEPEFNPKLGEMWEFEGFLKFSPIFYGYYSNVEISRSGFWRNPLAYLLSAMLTYLFCFFCISRKLSQNTKLSRIGSKDDEYTFCWTVFVGWDFMIGNSETAYNKTSSLVMNLKEGILEEKEQTKDRDWRLIIRRVLANVLTLMLIVASAYVVTLAVQRSENLPEDASLLQKNELQLVMSGIQFMFPPLFDVIGIIEKYHPRKALSWQLGRILFLDFLNFYTLMFSLFGTVDQMGIQLNEVAGNITLFRKNHTYYNNLFITTTTTTTTTSTTTAIPTTTIFNSITADVNTTTTFLNTSLPDSNSSSTMTTVFNESTTTAIGITSTNFSQSLLTTTTTEASTTTTISESTTIFVAPLPPSTTTITITSAPSSLPADTSTTLSTTTKSEEEDYPDLSDALKASTRLKREDRPNELDDLENLDTEREESSASEYLMKRTTASRLELPAIPPIQDPYRRIGVAQVYGTSRYQDEDEEEPLEGRLEVKPTSTTRKPRYGVARPIGGKSDRPTKSRVKVTTLPATDLNDDAEEDLQSFAPPSQRTIISEDILNQQNQLTQSSDIETLSEVTTSLISQTSASLSPDYTVLSPEPTTNSEGLTDQQQSSIGGELSQSQNTPSLNVDQPLGKSSLSSSTSLGTSQTNLDPSDMSSKETATQTSASCTPRPFDSTTPMVLMGNKSVAKLKKSGFNASEVSYSDCLDIPEVKYQEITALNETFKEKLKTLCWETMFGQEMVKIVVMDLVMTVISAVSFEFMRACFVRYCNRFFFWDLERGFPGYQDFKLAENVLHLVNNQSTVWMGMFFAPGLPAINTVKLAVLMYVRSWAVLTCNIPHETVFKVSKSNNFYYWILLINLLICILPVAYAVTWIRPSWHCGPFGGECRMYIVVTKLVKSLLPPEANSVFKYLTSPGAVIPILISLILIIYYLASTVSSSKEANKELKAQLKKDKEQEAAVPEITNTTVVDPAPTVIPASQPIAAPVAVNSIPVASVDKEAENKPTSLLMPPAL